MSLPATRIRREARVLVCLEEMLLHRHGDAVNARVVRRMREALEAVAADCDRINETGVALCMVRQGPKRTVVATESLRQHALALRGTNGAPRAREQAEPQPAA